MKHILLYLVLGGIFTSPASFLSASSPIQSEIAAYPSGSFADIQADSQVNTHESYSPEIPSISDAALSNNSTHGTISHDGSALSKKEFKKIKKQAKKTQKKLKKAARHKRKSTHVQPKTLIWDLGNTLFRISKMGMAHEIGLRDFALYKLWDGQDPVRIQELAFKILDELKEHTCKHELPKNGNLTVPALMCDWFLGTATGKVICEKLDKKIEELAQKNYFFNDREKRLVGNMVQAMLDPEKLAQHMKPIKPAIRILAECSAQLTQQGQQAHELLILSNWDPASFDHLYRSSHGRKIFNFFKPENIVISGDIGLIKPDPAIYKYVLDTYKLDPKNCIVIDDQQENINAAQALGMTGLLLEDFDYKKLRQQLQQLQVL